MPTAAHSRPLRSLLFYSRSAFRTAKKPRFLTPGDQIAHQFTLQGYPRLARPELGFQFPGRMFVPNAGRSALATRGHLPVCHVLRSLLCQL